MAQVSQHLSCAPTALAVASLSLDAVEGCGGTLARLASEGARVVYTVVFRTGFPEDRLQRACRLLGIASGDLLSLGMDPRLPPERAHVPLREALSEIHAAYPQAALVFAPSLQSADPRDEMVARTAFDVFRECTVVCYDCGRPTNSAGRPVMVRLTRSQLQSKMLAMRPRRLRPGGIRPTRPAAAAELLDLLRWQQGGSPPLEELRRAAEAYEGR